MTIYLELLKSQKTVAFALQVRHDEFFIGTFAALLADGIKSLWMIRVFLSFVAL